jgi:hypothetical protein
VCFLQIAVTQAQEEYQMQIDNIFEIPAGKIPSGILIERSPALLDMNGYNPANKPQIDTCSLFKWMCIYYRLYASHLNLEDFQYDIWNNPRIPTITKPNYLYPWIRRKMEPMFHWGFSLWQNI